jgi:ABC-type branched-subunit amino acid transport system permease subunit
MVWWMITGFQFRHRGTSLIWKSCHWSCSCCDVFLKIYVYVFVMEISWKKWVVVFSGFDFSGVQLANFVFLQHLCLFWVILSFSANSYAAVYDVHVVCFGVYWRCLRDNSESP